MLDSATTVSYTSNRRLNRGATRGLPETKSKRTHERIRGSRDVWIDYRTVPRGGTGAALAHIAERHAGDPATMADAIRGYLSPRELAVAPVAFTPAVEVEERVAA